MNYQYLAKWILAVGFTIIFGTASSSSVKTYEGYQLISVKNIETEDQLEALISLQNSMPNLDFWSEPSLTAKTDIMVSPEDRKQVKDFLLENDLEYDVTMQDVGSYIEKEVSLRVGLSEVGSSMSWTAYQRVHTIYTWLEKLALQYPRILKLFNLGVSYERRDIKIVKISTGGSKFKLKPAIFIDAGMHAREWISVATATFLINELLNVSSADKDVLKGIDWFIVPVLNPDGYEYSHTQERLWRKTRSRYGDGDCAGVDFNRNFGGSIHWGEFGVSMNPCSEVYPGPYPYSEVEVNATAQFLYARRNQIKTYISLHSFSQKWLSPYGYTTKLPEDYADLVLVPNFKEYEIVRKELADKALEVLKIVNGTEYTTAPSSKGYHLNSGDSRDWAKAVAEIKYSYTIELSDTGEYGFLLPPSRIILTGKETWETLKVVARHLIKKYPAAK